MPERSARADWSRRRRTGRLSQWRSTRRRSTRWRSTQRRGTQRRGTTIVETALILPLLLFLTMGAVQYGILMNATSALTNLARDAARYGAIHAFDGTAAQSDAAVRAYIREKARNTIIAPSSLPDSVITISSPSRAPGEKYEVDINYSLKQKVFMGFIGTSLIGKNPRTGEVSGTSGYRIQPGDYTASSIVLIEGIS